MNVWLLDTLRRAEREHNEPHRRIKCERCQKQIASRHFQERTAANDFTSWFRLYVEGRTKLIEVEEDAESMDWVHTYSIDRRKGKYQPDPDESPQQTYFSGVVGALGGVRRPAIVKHIDRDAKSDYIPRSEIVLPDGTEGAKREDGTGYKVVRVRLICPHRPCRHVNAVHPGKYTHFPQADLLVELERAHSCGTTQAFETHHVTRYNLANSRIT